MRTHMTKQERAARVRELLADRERREAEAVRIAHSHGHIMSEDVEESLEHHYRRVTCRACGMWVFIPAVVVGTRRPYIGEALYNPCLGTKGGEVRQEP